MKTLMVVFFVPLAVGTWWAPIVATLINGTLVMLAVEGLKWLLPILKAQNPWALRVLAMVAPFILGEVAEQMMTYLGYPIDLSPIVDLITGFGAILTFHGVRAIRNGGDA